MIGSTFAGLFLELLSIADAAVTADIANVNHCTCFLIIQKVMFKCAESAPIELGEIILVYELEAIHYF